jgi:predicted translin family RNA/ssDNA-binding protein
MNQMELQALGKIESRLARLEALQESNIRTINDLTANVSRLVEKLDRSDDIARDADQRARSAHHRLDELKKEVDGLRENGNWLPKLIASSVITTIIGGAIGGVLATATGG